MFLPYGRQVIEDDDIAEVVRVLKGDFLTTGPEPAKFEDAFAEYVKAPHAVSCANGTAALHLICLALGIGQGDQVIVPSISFVATANAVRYCGGEVVFADVDPQSGHMTAQTLKDAMARADTNRLKAVIVVHLGGAAVDLAGISAITRDAGLTLVEDACHAVGSTYPLPDGGTGHVGDCRLSLMCAFSFHPVKTLTTGEGGAITTSDPELARRLLLLRNHGLEREPARWLDPSIGKDTPSGEDNPWVYELQDLGYNYRLTDFQAALGRNQLKKMPRFADTRKALAKRYVENFSGLDQSLIRLAPPANDEGAVLHLMSALLDYQKIGMTRREVMAWLREKGIGTQVHYIPIHRQPYYRQIDTDLRLPGAETYYSACLSLPFFAGMTLEDADRVSAAFSDLLAQKRS